MSTKQPKRNDPCPCGSGKLYKHCCKPSRRERFRHQRKIALAPAPVEAPESGAQSPSSEIHSMFRDLKRHVPPDRIQEFEHVFDLAEEIAAYEEMHDEIEAAAQTLEAHFAEFKALDMQGAEELAGRLFAEERFRPLHFSTEDVYSAFEVVGYPQRHSKPTPQDGEILRDAILYLTDQDLRRRLARKLMMWLPEYVSAGRCLEAWMLQYCSFQMLEAPDESNPFLGEMFRHGFVEWAKQVQAQQDGLLRELGIDHSDVAGMSPHEMEAWLQERMAAPETETRLDAYLTTHPILGGQVEADHWELQRASLQLLERDDAERFLLSPEEVEPWMPTLLERLEPMKERAMKAAERGAWDDADIQKSMRDVLFEVAQKMAPLIFTPERLDQLVADLKAHRRDLDETGEKKPAMYAHTVAISLERTETPAEERFVIGVCMASLRLMLIALSERAQAEMNAEEE